MWETKSSGNTSTNIELSITKAMGNQKKTILVKVIGDWAHGIAVRDQVESLEAHRRGSIFRQLSDWEIKNEG